MNKQLFKVMLAMIIMILLVSACAPAATPVAEKPAQAVENEAPKAEATVAAPAAPTEAPAVASPTVAAAEPVEISEIELWAGGRVTESGPPPDDWVAYQAMKDKAGVNLKLVLLPSTQSDQDARINTAAASNSLPDVFMVNRDVLYKLVQAGLVAQVDELLPLMPVRAKGHYSDADRNKLATWDGVMYGLPDPGALPQTDALVIRQDWLDKLGLTAPKTLDEFLAVAKDFTYKDPDGNGKNDTYGFCAFIDGSGISQIGLGPRFDFIYGAYGVAGPWNLSSADTVGLNARSSNYMKATEFIKTMNDEKVIDPDWPTLKKDEFRARWKQGKCGMMIENFAALSTKSNYKDFDANFPEGSWVAMDAPTGPDGESSMGVVAKAARIYAISQKAMEAGKGPAIARLLEWMASDEGYYLLGFGVEGENYVTDDDGYVSTEGIAKEKAWTAQEMQPLTQLANMVYIFSDVEMQARYPSHETANGRTLDPKAYYAEFLTKPYTQATGAGVIDPPSNAADFTRFYSENLAQFVLGQKPMNETTWAEYIAGLDSLGAKELEEAAKETLLKTGFIK